ncbi:MAG: bifunctional riboflavin kinase/FAD synthetase [Firmicutes bacterium]|nr:bifunctional riboflavin kinase/FAD synthetase [Bacillota bacterium]
MQTISSSQENTVIAIGKFEALHKGHASLIETTIKYAQQNNAKSCAMHFMPNPVKVLHNNSYKPLFTKEEHLLLLSDYNLDYSIPFIFDKRIADLTPFEFCNLIKQQFNCSALIIGEEFRFGRNRSGGLETLEELSQALNIKLLIVPSIKHDLTKISSSQIRRYLEKSQIRQANEMLNRPFLIMGTVKQGRQLGRTIGFPTANITPKLDKFLPPNGVYITQIILDGTRFDGVTNIGTNPTVTNETTCKVETYIFDFDKDIYGKEIIVEFYEFIRPEQTFSGLNTLKAQMLDDARIALNFQKK